MLQLLACDCKRKCVAGSCICIDNDLRCTDSCKFDGCENMRIDEGVETDVSDWDSSDDENDDEVL